MSLETAVAAPDTLSSDRSGSVLPPKRGSKKDKKRLSKLEVVQQRMSSSSPAEEPRSGRSSGATSPTNDTSQDEASQLGVVRRLMFRVIGRSPSSTPTSSRSSMPPVSPRDTSVTSSSSKKHTAATPVSSPVRSPARSEADPNDLQQEPIAAPVLHDDDKLTPLRKRVPSDAALRVQAMRRSAPPPITTTASPSKPDSVSNGGSDGSSGGGSGGAGGAVSSIRRVGRESSVGSLMSSASQGGNFADLLESLRSGRTRNDSTSSLNPSSPLRLVPISSLTENGSSNSSFLPERKMHPVKLNKATEVIKADVEAGRILLPVVMRVVIPEGGGSIGIFLRGIKYTRKDGQPERYDGLYVRSVTPGSPCALAGITRGDRVYNIQDGVELRSWDGIDAQKRVSSLVAYLSQLKDPRERVLLIGVLRHPPLLKEITIAVDETGYIGANVKRNIFLDIEKDGPAEKAGIVAGMEIVRINGKPLYKAIRGQEMLHATLLESVVNDKPLKLSCIRLDLARSLGFVSEDESTS